MYEETDKKADVLIREKIIYSMGAGFIPLPGIDLIALTKVQLDMLKELCEMYEVEYTEHAGKALVSSLGFGFLGKIGSSAMKFVPLFGSIAGGISAAAFAGASTYALGQVFKKYLKDSGSIWEISKNEVKDFYKKAYERGKDVAESLSRNKGNAPEDVDMSMDDDDNDEPQK